MGENPVDLSYNAADSPETENHMPEDLTLGAAAVGYLTESMHGAGSPQAQRVMIARGVDLKKKRAAAKHLCGIPEE